jgi:hypothetical protein
MREIRLYGSEGGGAHTLPTPIRQAKYPIRRLSAYQFSRSLR